VGLEIKWEDVIGDKTLEKGGYAGDLLELTLIHLNQAKRSGQLTAAQVGEIYATTISSSIDRAIMFAMEKELKQEMLVKAANDRRVSDVDTRIVEDPTYALSKLVTLSAEKDLAVNNAASAGNQNLILGENLKTEKERNGDVGYIYVYNYAYYDINEMKIEVAPTYNEEGELEEMPTEIAVTETLFVYRDGLNNWVVSDNYTTEVIKVTRQCYSYERAGEVVDTNVDYTVLHMTYAVKDTSGNIAIVDSDGTVYTGVGGIDDKLGELLADSTIAEITDRYNEDPTAEEFEKFEYLALVDGYASADNENNHEVTRFTEPGWDGNSENPDNKPMTAKVFTYRLFEDKSSIHDYTIVNRGEPGSVSSKSVTLLEKEKANAEALIAAENLTIAEKEALIVEDANYVTGKVSILNSEVTVASKKALQESYMADDLSSKKGMSAIEYAVMAQASYQADKQAIRTAEKDIAKSNSGVAAEEYTAAREKNGKVNFTYVYNYKYEDLNGVRHVVSPTMDDDGITPIAPDPMSVTESVVMSVVKGGRDTWELQDNSRVEPVVVTVDCMSYVDGTNIERDTTIYSRPELNKLSYVLSDVTGAYLLVTDEATPIVIQEGTGSTDLNELKVDADGEELTQTGWADLYTEYTEDATVDKFSDIVTMAHVTTFPSARNAYNYNEVRFTEAGWDGEAANPDNKPNTVKELTYALVEDRTDIYKVVENTTGVAGSNLDKSLIKLQKEEIVKNMELANAKLTLSKIPSTLK